MNRINNDKKKKIKRKKNSAINFLCIIDVRGNISPVSNGKKLKKEPNSI